MRVLPLFSRSTMSTECDVCARRFDLMTGGVCMRCQRVLCARHLHGSFFRRLAVDLGATPLCVECRAGRGPGAAESSSH